MRTLSLAAIAAAVITASFTPSLAARQQPVTRFEYLRGLPYPVLVQRNGQSVVNPSGGLKACMAASTDWVCRDFPATPAFDAAFRSMLTTLGDEGWELVSAGDEPNGIGTGALLFKRQR